MMKTYRERTAEAAIAARNKYKVAEIASADFWATIHFFVKGA
jgi:hypothetical protein